MEKANKPKRVRKVYHIRCYGCNKIANYGFSNGKKVSCAEHKVFGMINKSPLKCREVGCDRFASFGIEGKRHYCSFHKTDDMVLFNGARNYQQKTKKRKIDDTEGEIAEFLENLKRHKSD